MMWEIERDILSIVQEGKELSMVGIEAFPLTGVSYLGFSFGLFSFPYYLVMHCCLDEDCYFNRHFLLCP